MEVIAVADVLAPYGLRAPCLEFLRPNEHQYTALLMQPAGPLFAGSSRIGPADQDRTNSRCRAFLELARDRSAHLAITPEYFFSWATLRDAIANDVTPASEALWILGSESTTQEDIEQFKSDVAHSCLVLHEPWGNLSSDRSILDPAVLLFQATRPDGSLQLVALIQFKTYPSRDEMFFEESLLRTGTLLYKFTGSSTHLSATTIICSDAFAIEPVLSQLNDRSTLIHIQLNPNPTHSVYRKYRASTFETDPKATNCHIVCLNWAHLIEEVGDSDEPAKQWKNISASAWYCPQDECSSKDAIVSANHRHGLYYTYMSERRHALRFHYEEAVFELLVPKLVRLGLAIMANRNGPTMVLRRTWDDEQLSWSPAATPAPDGSLPYIEQHTDAHRALADVLAANDPLAVERVLALSCGSISGGDSWHSLDSLDACTTGPDEVVKRLSFVPDASGNDFRFRRLQSAAEIQHELTNRQTWPSQVSDLCSAATIHWSAATPNFNVRSAAARPALVVYLDDSHPPEKAANKADMFCDLLRRRGGRDQTRLCVMRRTYGQLDFVPLDALTRYDDAILEQTDITAVRPLEVKGAGNE